MDDIRSKRYKLNKVMVDGEVPGNNTKITNHARDIILDFIRSRPPLRPVSSRKVAPARRRESTPVEALMESIRNSAVRSSLRKTSGPVIKKSSELESYLIVAHEPFFHRTFIQSFQAFPPRTSRRGRCSPSTLTWRASRRRRATS
jgi:hypothetical protein